MKNRTARENSSPSKMNGRWGSYLYSIAFHYYVVAVYRGEGNIVDCTLCIVYCVLHQNEKVWYTEGQGKNKNKNKDGKSSHKKRKPVELKNQKTEVRNQKASTQHKAAHT